MLTASFLCPNSLKEAEKLKKEFEEGKNTIEVGRQLVTHPYQAADRC